MHLRMIVHVNEYTHVVVLLLQLLLMLILAYLEHQMTEICYSGQQRICL